MKDDAVRPERTVATVRATRAISTELATLTDRLTSPFWLAVLVVALVASTGIFATLSSYRTQRRSGEAAADAAFRSRSALLRVALGDALVVAEPLLDRLEEAVRARPSADPVEPLFDTMAELATARRGLTWMSVSFPDGTFVGVYTEDGKLRGQESRVGPSGGIERTYDRDANGRFVSVTSRPTNYDPRTRTFYRLAETRGARTWTEPYPFLPHLRTGVTRTAPIYQDSASGRQLLAVLTADFDASGMADLLGRAPPGERYLVTVGDAVLAMAGIVDLPMARRSRERPLMLSDLDDRVVREATNQIHGAARTIRVAGVPFRHEREIIGDSHGLSVELHAFVDERRLFANADREARSGAFATTLASLASIGVALLISAQVARLRRKREEAERDADLARADVEELGTYRLLERIGAGGMGEVWRARHMLLARDSAIKLIKPSDDPSDEISVRRRFNEEARVLAGMRSVHTVSVHDFGVASDGRYFLVMELLDGLDLETLVREHGPQPAARVADILAQVCDSLAEAHAAGLVHQDIKPANIFLCRLAEALDVVKVLDFGLTRAVGRRRDDGRTEGTPAFMAPEQARGEAVTPSTDLYAVGCVGYYLLTGKLPYQAQTGREHMRAHVVEPVPELPADLTSTLPPALVQLITRSMAKKPEHRPISARALASALREVARQARASFDEEARTAFWSSVARRDSASPASPEGADLAEGAAGETRRVRRSWADAGRAQTLKPGA